MKRKIKFGWLWSIPSGVIIGLLVEHFKVYPIISNMWDGIVFVWGKFVWFMTIDIKLWWILLASVIILTILCVKIKINFTTNIPPKEKTKPKILNYTSENYKGILWQFSWTLYHNEWDITDLTPCCPKDKTPLCGSKCPRCDSEYFGKEGLNYEMAETLIIDNAKKLL